MSEDRKPAGIVIKASFVPPPGFDAEAYLAEKARKKAEHEEAERLRTRAERRAQREGTE
jgi:hypothetical protein